MKRFFTLLPLLIFTLTISAADGDVKKATVDGVEWTYTIVSESDKTCMLGSSATGDDGTAVYNPAIDVNTTGEITIPGTLDGYTVVTIGKEAFRGCKIATVTIPAEVTYIDDNAFADCSKLGKVTCNGQPYDISESAFEGRYSKATAYYPKGCGEAFQSKKGWNKFSKWYEYRVEEDYLYRMEKEIMDLDKLLSAAYDNLKEKATESEKPDLYAMYKDLYLRLKDAKDYHYAFVHEGCVTIDEVQKVDAELHELDYLVKEFKEQVDQYQPSNKIAINEETFPDANFRDWVLATDYGKDSVLTEEEIAGVILINVAEKNISDLKGIEYFTAVLSLDCSNNQLTSLDISKNTALSSLSCGFNKLTTLDITKNTALKQLDCLSNQLTSIDVSKNVSLISLVCDNNKLTSLELSNNTLLQDLCCGDNQLASLDVSKNTALEHIECVRSQLTSLDLTNNTALTSLECYENKLTTLDVSKNTQLERLHCPNNQLTSLDVSNIIALKELNCINNQLTTLDVSKNTQLERLYCQVNQLTSLNVSNTALKELYCDGNQIKGEAMDALINSLPTVSEGIIVVIDTSSGAHDGNTCTMEQVTAAKAKGWKVMAYTNAGNVEYEGGDTLEVDPTKVIEATCKQVIDGPDGAIYRVTGVCKEILNMDYGNWYLEDETGTIYIYGTVDSNGQYPRYTSWESFGINEGDTITVQGRKKTYANTPELVDVRVLRPLTLLSKDRININYEERVDTIRLYCEGESYEVEIPADATWVTIKEQTTGKDPIIVLHIDENKGKERGTLIKISSNINGQKYETSVTVTQHPYYFKAKTVEGVELSYRVVTETPTKTCYVSGAGEDLYAYYAALDTLTTGHVTIPAEVNGYTVTALDGYAFKNCRNITGVTMPESLWLINSYAFKGCNSLADIQFSSNLNSMGLEIFEETAWFANQPDGMVYINDSLLYVYKGEMPADTHIDVKEGCTYIGYSSFVGQSNLTSITLPETVKTIEGFAFSRTGIKEVVIPKSCTLMGGRSFYYCSELEKVTFLGQPEIRRSSFSHCDKLSTIICQSETAWSPIYTDCFYLSRDDKDASIYERATLYVPHGSKEAYQAVAPWSEFQNIVEMDLAPINNDTNVDIGTDINTDTNLDGNVVGNILYNISSGNGEFDSENGCIVVNKPVSDETMSNLEGKDIFGEDFKDQYTGIVLKVAEGKGEIKVKAETTGNMVLKIKVGNSAPIKMELEGKLTVTWPYDVSEETLVYIYGSTNAAQAKRNMKGVTNTESGSLKIFGIEVTREGTGIQDITLDEGPQDVYSLSGQKIRSQAKDLNGLPAGVYIVGGKKIFVK